MAREIKEDTIAKASYIVTFFQELQQLTWQISIYINTLVQIQMRYPKKDKELEAEMEAQGMDDADQMALANSIQNVKNFVFMSYVKFSALKKQIEEFKKYEKEIDKYYYLISGNVVPSKEDVENFAISMNKLFVEGVVGELLGGAGAVLRSITEPKKSG